MSNDQGINQEIGSAAKNLGQQTQKINTALKYTEGNMDLAKKMAAGELKNIYILKFKIRSDLSREFGLAVIFLNKIGLHVASMNIAMTRSPYVFDIKTNIPWSQYINEVNSVRNDSDFDDKLSNKVSDSIQKYLQIPIVAQIVQYVDDKNHDELTALIHSIFKSELQMGKSQIKVDFDMSNSLVLEEAGVEDSIVIKKQQSAVSDSDTNDGIPPDIKKKAVEAIQAATVLSPTKGKELGKLQVGEKIKVHITDATNRGRNIIKILNAETEEGALKPVAAKLRYIKKKNDGNWLLLADLGENTLVRIEEETDSVRVAMVDAQPAKGQQSRTGSSSGTNMPMVIGIITAAVAIVITVLVFIFL